MVISFLQRLLWLVVLVAAQMMVFNYIHLFGYATPLPYVYLLLLFPLNSSRWSILLWGFVCGLLCDFVSMTPGLGAASMTLVAFVQPLLLRAMAPKDALEDMQASYHTLSFWGYVRYAGILTLLFAITYFLLLSLSFFHAADFAIAFASSWALTLVICLAIESVRSSRRKEHEA